LLRPEIKVSLLELDSGQLLRLSRRLLSWSRDVVNDVVGVLRDTPAAPWSAAGRGLIYQLEQSLGSMPTQHAKQQLSELTASDRASLAGLRIQLGREVIYAEATLQPRQRLARLALAQAFAPRDIRALPSLSSRVSFRAPQSLDAVWLNHVGFVLLGARAIRADIADRVSKELWLCSRGGSFTPPAHAAQWLGCSTTELGELAVTLGYRRDADGQYRAMRRQRRRRGRHPVGTT
jgi:ATP-dependent RNA helicase SUPV3L1/SUV3